MGVEWVQIDPPAHSFDLDTTRFAACTQAYAALSCCGVKLQIATYFDSVASHVSRGWPGTENALRAMVAAVEIARSRLMSQAE